MNEGISAIDKQDDKVNSFELVEHNNIFVPRILLEAGREQDLSDYTKGWMDQDKNPVEIIVPTESRNDRLRTANDWYKTGAVKRWSRFPEHNQLEGQPEDLSHIMEEMRTNTKRIPKTDFPFRKEDFGSDAIRDNPSKKF